MNSKPKVLLHEHLDSSLRPTTMLELWKKIGFDSATIPFPECVLRHSRTTNDVDDSVATEYREWLVDFASKSLTNYIDAIVHHVLPVMQTKSNLTRIAQERIEDAIEDGIIALELRFAPQLHLSRGLTLRDVMDAVIEGVRFGQNGQKKQGIQVKLIICTLRHENFDMAKQLVELAVKYSDIVGSLDLAGDEDQFPGVLSWYVRAVILMMIKLHLSGNEQMVAYTIHLWETKKPVEADVEMLELLEGGRTDKLRELVVELLEEFDGKRTSEDIETIVQAVVRQLQANATKSRIGHGITGNAQGTRILEVCPTSNVVTGQVPSFVDHPIDRLLREKRRVTVNTDGTLFTKTTLSKEYTNLRDIFGWSDAEFFAANEVALAGSNFSPADKQDILLKLKQAYAVLERK